MDYIIFISGFALLIFGGEMIVENIEKISLYHKIPQFIVSSFIIGFGTSLPEVVLSINSLIADENMIIIGNVLGSNIANLLFILGVISLIVPINLNKFFSKRELTFLLYISLIASLLLFTQPLFFVHAIIFGVLFLGYLRDTGKNMVKYNKEYTTEKNIKKPGIFSYGIILLSLAALGFGSDLLLRATVNIANDLKIDPYIIAITVLAVGTSLPELFASYSAARRKNFDIILGNIVGSNLLNTLLILPIAFITDRVPLTNKQLYIDTGFMLFSTILVVFICIFLKRINMITGLFFLCLFALYMLFTTESIKIPIEQLYLSIK